MWDSRFPIAEGATAQLFAFGEGQVLKRYRVGYSLNDAVSEAKKARTAHRNLAGSGLTTPALTEIGEYKGQPGVVFERVTGVSLLENLFADRQGFPARGVELAGWHRMLHACSGESLPCQKEALLWKCTGAGCRADFIEKATDLLGSLPEGDRLCHGDFHPGNLLLTPGGPAVIDWVDAVCGDPLADVARTVLLLLTASVPLPANWTSQSLWLARRRFVRHYLTAYSDNVKSENGAGIEEGTLLQWLFVVAVARHSEGRPDRAERRRLGALCKRLLPILTGKAPVTDAATLRFLIPNRL